MQALKSVDHFRRVSREVTHGTATGGIFTAVAYCCIILIVIQQIGAFVRTEYVTKVLVEERPESVVQLNFDVHMYDLPCKFIQVQVYDKLAQETINADENVKYIDVDHKGDEGGTYTKQEIGELEHDDMITDITPEEKAEFDADWMNSTDHFKHNDFEHVVSFHNFTLINFYADWCGHCREFHPAWSKMSQEISEKKQFKHGSGHLTTVKFIRVNCVDYKPLCTRIGIKAYPSLRLYEKDTSYEEFHGKRTPENITAWINEVIEDSELSGVKHHNIFKSGCKVSGFFRVPRLPGHLHIRAEPFSKLNLDPALTNVSHHVAHLSFEDPGVDRFALKKALHAMPLDFKNQFSRANVPLNGKSFIVTRFHEAPGHEMKLVSTRAKGFVFYQINHADRTRHLKRESHSVPQAQFSYDFSPLCVEVIEKKKRWYELLTSIFAIMGGTYTVIELMSGTVNTVKDAIGKSA